MLWGNSSVVAAVVVLARYFLDNFSKKSSFLDIFIQKLHFVTFLFLKVVFFPKNFRRRHACPHFSAFYFGENIHILSNSHHFLTKTVISGEKLTFQAIFFLKGHFSAINFRRRHVPPHFSACFDRGPFNNIQGHLLLKYRFLPPRIY